MVDINNGLLEAVRGVVAGVIGKAKAVISMLTGRNDLFKEGQAQQDKAEAQRTAGKKEAQAEKARAEAKVHEAREQDEQH